MASAQIGALRVALGLDSAQFSSGLKKAQGGLSNFGKTAAIGLGAVATAATAAAVALGYAVKKAIDHADEIGKTAQKVGVTTEALSRLEFAAQLSDVSLEGLSGGLKKLGVNLLTVAQGGTGPAKAAFDALGISVKDAEGKLKSSDVVFAEVAERFGRMEDGATKTGLAVALLGKSGSDLIPLLNEGADGLARMADESDRTGNTISGTTAAAAEQFNDTLTTIQQTLTGLVNQIAVAVLPTLQDIADTLAPPKFAQAAKDFATTVIGGLNAIVQAGIQVIATIRSIGATLNYMGTHDLFGNQIEAAKKGSVRYAIALKDAKDKIREALNSGDTAGADMEGFFGSGGQQELPAWFSGGGDTPFKPLITDLGAAGDAASKLKEIMAEGKSVFEATRTPAEAYSLEIERLNGLLSAGAINQDTYNRAVIDAQEAFDAANPAAQAFKATMDTVQDAASSALSGLITDAIKGEDVFDNLLGAVGRLGDRLIQMATDELIAGLFKNILGAALGGGTGTATSFIPGIGSIGNNARGTDNWRGGLTWVGEEGPEIVDLPRGSKVYPNGEGPGGGISITIDARGAQLGVAEQIEEFARWKLPSIIRHHSGTTMAENG